MTILSHLLELESSYLKTWYGAIFQEVSYGFGSLCNTLISWGSLVFARGSSSFLPPSSHWALQIPDLPGLGGKTGSTVSPWKNGSGSIGEKTQYESTRYF
jgi:hypothetical protein